MWRHSEKAAICEPTSNTSGPTRPTSFLALGLPAPQTCKKQVSVCLSHAAAYGALLTEDQGD